jgi:hypothetical protein
MSRANGEERDRQCRERRGEPRVDDDRVGPVHLPKRDHGASVRRSRTARIGLAAEAR